MGFMVRYLEVVTGEMARMKVARESRGFRPAVAAAWPALATTGRRPVHPLLRARRARAPRDAVPRLPGQLPAPTPDGDPRSGARRRYRRGLATLLAAVAL